MTTSEPAGPGYGNHRLVVGVEIARTDTLTDDGKLRARSVAFDVIENAFKLAGIPAGQRIEQVRGNGLVAVLAPDVSPTQLLGYWVEHAHQQLRHRNKGRQPRVQLQIGMHVGTVYLDAHGPAGVGVDVTCALRDSVPASLALDVAPEANLVLAVSDHLYRSSVLADGPWIEPEHYAAAWVTGDGLDGQAWFYVPRRSGALFPVANDERAGLGGPARTGVPAGVGVPAEPARSARSAPESGNPDELPAASAAAAEAAGRGAKYIQEVHHNSFGAAHFGDSYGDPGQPNSGDDW
jgi:hypothetical protein